MVQDLVWWNKVIYSDVFLMFEFCYVYFSFYEVIVGCNVYVYGWEVFQIDGYFYFYYDGMIMGYICDLFYEL